ncbi:four-carbon acid sugar kinase family protein [Aurantimonas sp. A2-1-M11]|uniref:four-carbon acid sugar kinase family protein n=1 Tax=Aurantimonas sp. A2-1-M11 TaxID=3113712 RepID=UPI002F946B63
MTVVRILADDLTGALDAAAPFATPSQPVHLSIDPSLPQAEAKRTASSESRESALSTALEQVQGAFARVRPGVINQTLWFKKVDSVLRGWPVEETLELMRLTNRRVCVFAPAFPEMGRRTIGGYHETVDPEQPNLWAPAAIHDLRDAFERRGAKTSLFNGRPATTGVVIGDAVEPADLRQLVRGFTQQEVLWAGSRGLAEALCQPCEAIDCPRISVVVVGTTHPVTRRQTRTLLDAGGGNVVLIDPVSEARSADETARHLHEAVVRLEPPRNHALMVVGGKTLMIVLAAVKAQSLACVGEISPGLPLSRIIGGRFDGLEVVTKSGGFGQPDLFLKLAAANSC